MADTVVLIPAYNEEKNIKETVTRVKKLGFLPLVVDDASIDSTSDIAKKHGAIVLRHQVNGGKGEAVKTGFGYIFKNLKVRYVVLLDADLQYKPEEIPNMLSELKDGSADFVMGYRDWSLVPFRHRFGNLVWRIFFNILFGTKMRDTNCGFMGMTIQTAKKIGGLGRGYVIDNHIVSQVVRNKLRIGQVPVSIYYRHKSKTLRGLRMVAGVLIFILIEGAKYRLRIGMKR